MTIIEQIKAEVERRIELHDSLASNAESEMIANLEIGAAQALDDILPFLSTLESENPKEQQEVDLEKFTEKMDAWKARYNHPDNISIKATMAFTARMFYMYPKVAREWYDSLPKVTQD